MKKIILLLFFSVIVYGKEIHEFTRTTDLGDSLAVMPIQIYDSGSSDWKTRGITFSNFNLILADSVVVDSTNITSVVEGSPSWSNFEFGSIILEYTRS